MPRCLLVFEPPDGGVAENVLQLARGLPAHGWQPVVAGPAASVIYDELEAAGVAVHRLAMRRGYGRPDRDARSVRELAAVLARERFDLVHAHAAKAGVLGRLAARRARVPAVYSPHCFPFVGPWGIGRRAFSVTVERALGRRTGAILCVAEAERREALARGVAPAARLHVIHNGSAPCPSGLEPDEELATFAAGGPLAATLSVLRPQKGVHHFIEAAPAILAAVPDARLAVIGNDVVGVEPLRPRLEARARELGLDGRLRFFDFRPPPARQLQDVHVFVLPSDWEAFPISILEAMACGVPQVVTDVGGSAEAVAGGETGVVIPPGDPARLADAVAGLLADAPLREAMGAAARERHAERFGLERMVARTASLYDAVVAR